jgi:hypothetical protein
MTEDEARLIYFVNYGNLFRMSREEPFGTDDEFLKLRLPKEEIAEWNRELFDYYFPRRRFLPIGLPLKGLMDLAATIEGKAAVVDFLLEEGKKDIAFMKGKADEVILGQPSEATVGYYYGFLEEACEANRFDLVQRYAAPFAEYAFWYRKENYKSLDTLISFDVIRKAGLSRLYVGRDDEFDRRDFADSKLHSYLSPFYEYLSGFATGAGPSKREALRYLESIKEKRIMPAGRAFNLFGLEESEFRFLAELAS